MGGIGSGFDPAAAKGGVLAVWDKPFRVACPVLPGRLLERVWLFKSVGLRPAI